MELMNLAQVATMLNTPQSTLRWWRHIGSGPASFKIGARVMYRKSDVEAWLAAQIKESIGGAA